MDVRAKLPTHAKTSDGKVYRLVGFDEHQPELAWLSNGFTQFSAYAERLIFIFEPNIGLLDLTRHGYRCSTCGLFANREGKEGPFYCRKCGPLYMVDQTPQDLPVRKTRARSYDTG